MLPHTITTYSIVTRTSDGYPKQAYSTSPSTWAARVVEKPVMVRDRMGVEKVCSGYAVINCTGSLSPEDKFVLPDATAPPLVALHKIPDEKGTHHYVAYFARSPYAR